MARIERINSKDSNESKKPFLCLGLEGEGMVYQFGEIMSQSEPDDNKSASTVQSRA